jgi:hypothetical protein
MTHTHTYAILEVTHPTYTEIAERLRKAKYDHAFGVDGKAEIVDMDGIALKSNAVIPAHEVTAKKIQEFIRGYIKDKGTSGLLVVASVVFKFPVREILFPHDGTQLVALPETVWPRDKVYIETGSDNRAILNAFIEDGTWDQRKA